MEDSGSIQYTYMPSLKEIMFFSDNTIEMRVEDRLMIA